MKYRRVGVVGAGVIGVGVAQTLAQTGHSVVLVDISEDILDEARGCIAKNLRFAALFDASLRMASHSEMLSRILFTTDYDQLAEVDLVVENSTENWSIKEPIYRSLDQICRSDCILAANTSAISISQLASVTQRPDRVIGMHFMNPVPQKAVVEVVRGVYTSDETVQAAKCFLEELSKRAVVVNDMPGFVANRVLMLAINEAIFVVHDNVAKPGEVDDIFVNCLAHRMGPLATADLIGLDTVLLTLDVLHQSYGASKYRPCPLLRQMVDAGLRGRKTGKGFFDYTEMVGAQDGYKNTDQTLSE
jgi:3-hydroxybutyryl-CoA dehydrogenase